MTATTATEPLRLAPENQNDATDALRLLNEGPAMSAATDMFSEIIRKKEAEIELLRAQLKAARNRLTHNPGASAMPTIEAIESILLVSLNTENVLSLEPYCVGAPHAARDQKGDLIAGVDGQINLTAIARAIVGAANG